MTNHLSARSTRTSVAPRDGDGGIRPRPIPADSVLGWIAVIVLIPVAVMVGTLWGWQPLPRADRFFHGLEDISRVPTPLMTATLTLAVGAWLVTVVLRVLLWPGRWIGHVLFALLAAAGAVAALYWVAILSAPLTGSPIPVLDWLPFAVVAACGTALSGDVRSLTTRFVAGQLAIVPVLALMAMAWALFRSRPDGALNTPDLEGILVFSWAFGTAVASPMVWLTAIMSDVRAGRPSRTWHTVAASVTASLTCLALSFAIMLLVPF